MIVKQCDRCKKYYRENIVMHNDDLVVGVALVVEHEGTPVCSYKYKKDLCDECAKDLEKWLESEVKENGEESEVEENG